MKGSTEEMRLSARPHQPGNAARDPPEAALVTELLPNGTDTGAHGTILSAGTQW